MRQACQTYLGHRKMQRPPTHFSRLVIALHPRQACIQPQTTRCVPLMYLGDCSAISSSAGHSSAEHVESPVLAGLLISPSAAVFKIELMLLAESSASKPQSFAALAILWILCNNEHIVASKPTVPHSLSSLCTTWFQRRFVVLPAGPGPCLWHETCMHHGSCAYRRYRTCSVDGDSGCIIAFLLRMSAADAVVGILKGQRV
jgi:hypothetical protein